MGVRNAVPASSEASEFNSENLFVFFYIDLLQILKQHLGISSVILKPHHMKVGQVG